MLGGGVLAEAHLPPFVRKHKESQGGGKMEKAKMRPHLDFWRRRPVLVGGLLAEAHLARSRVARLALLVQPVLGVGVPVELARRLQLVARPAGG